VNWRTGEIVNWPACRSLAKAGEIVNFKYEINVVYLDK